MQGSSNFEKPYVISLALFQMLVSVLTTLPLPLPHSYMDPGVLQGVGARFRTAFASLTSRFYSRGTKLQNDPNLSLPPFPCIVRLFWVFLIAPSVIQVCYFNSELCLRP